MPSYLSSTDLRARLNVSTTDVATALLDGLLNAVETAIRKYLGFSPPLYARTVYYNGSGTPELVLDGGPLRSVASVYENWQGYAQAANFTSANLLTAGADYFLDQPGDSTVAILRRTGGAVWPYMTEYPVGKLSGFIAPNHGSIQVTHTSGLDADDMAAIIEAGMLEATAIYRSWLNPIGSVTTDSMDGASVSITPHNFNRGRPRFVSPIAEMLLAPFRRIPVAS